MGSASFVNWHLSGHDQEVLRPSQHPAQDTRQHHQPNTEGQTPRMMFSFTAERLTVLRSASWGWTLTTICLLLNLFSPRTTFQVESEPHPPTRGQMCRVWPVVCQVERSPNPFLPQGPHFHPKSFSHQSAQLLQSPLQVSIHTSVSSHTLTVLMESSMCLHRAGKNHYCWPSMCRTTFYKLCLP